MRENPIVVALAEGTEAFLRFWYGVPADHIVVIDGEEPEALRRWWAYEHAWSQSLTHQNRVLSQSELLREDDHVVFYVENQDVVRWSYLAAEDAAVFECNSGETTRRPLGTDIASFLHQVAVFEATFGPYALLAGQVDGSDLRRLLGGFEKLPFRTWAGCQLWVTDELLANVVANQAPDDPITGDTTWLAMFSARDLDGLEVFADSQSMVWDYDARID